jgi:hypothetical protein
MRLGFFRDSRGCSRFPPARPQGEAVEQLRLLKQVVNEAAGEKNTGDVAFSPAQPRAVGTALFPCAVRRREARN